MSELPAIVSPGPAQRAAPAVLLGAGLPQGEQGGEPGALADALHFGAFSSEYIENLLESRDRLTAEPGPLHLTRPSDALELDLPDPES